MKLTLGPVLFNWPADTWRDFYFRIADEAPVDSVVIGEVVCSKRSPFFEQHIPAVIERLVRSGKEVLFASLALVTLQRERRATSELAETQEFDIEANDISCLPGLRGRPHAIGPFIQVYNEAAAVHFAGRGANRICLPPELPAESMAAIATAVPDVIVEAFGFGRAPLAISARCYHARLEGLSKDNCRFVCEKDPDGLAVKTLDREPFLAVNGVQTLSYACTNLVQDLSLLDTIGVRACRLSPHSCDMVAAAQVFRDVLDGQIDAATGLLSLGRLFPDAPFSNGFLHSRPGAEWVSG
jgi:collagenase-like PrtC family protease